MIGYRLQGTEEVNTQDKNNPRKIKGMLAVIEVAKFITYDVSLGEQNTL